MPAIADITGQRFERLVAQFPIYEKGHRKWVCICDCGNPVKASVGQLRAAMVRSCGCLAADKTGERATTHGATDTRLYMIWAGMKARCGNPKHSAFDRYGGRGILVCEAWQAFEPFRNWALANDYADNLSIDRTNNDAGYCPENCRWTDAKGQWETRRRAHRQISGLD